MGGPASHKEQQRQHSRTGPRYQAIEDSVIMNSQMKGLVISLGMMQVARKVPTDRPDVLMIIRVTYVLSQLLQVAIFYWASLKIKAKNDTTVLKYQEPPKGFGSTEPEEVGTAKITEITDETDKKTKKEAKKDL